jgi:predicted aspartyl protease
VALAAVVLAAVVLGAYLIGGATKGPERADAADFAPMQVLRSAHGDVTAVAAVTIKGRTYPFVVDTGASGSVLDIRVARRLGLAPIGEASKVTGVGGRVRAVPIIVRSWGLGPVPLPQLRIDAVRLPGAHAGGPVGLLGADVLSRFKSVTLDFKRQRLQLGR